MKKTTLRFTLFVLVFTSAIMVYPKEPITLADQLKSAAVPPQQILSLLKTDTTLALDTQAEYVKYLGESQCTEAIPYLIDHITFSYDTIKESPEIISFSQTLRLKKRVAYWAIINIGPPAIPYLTDKIKELGDNISGDNNLYAKAIEIIEYDEKVNQWLQDQKNKNK